MTPNYRDVSISRLGVVEFVNCFSLLVVLGSVSTSYFFSQLFHANLPLSFYWLLASTIWIIYSLDHVLDGLKKREESVSVRHYIHYKYRKILVPTIAAISVFNAVLAYMFLPKRILISGLGMAALVVLYFVIIHFFKRLKINWLKEFFVSMLVCWGMVVLPGVAGDMTFSPSSVAIVLCMVAINFSNLLLFSYFDYDEDVENGLTSAAVQWGKDFTQSVILHSLGIGFMCLIGWTFLIQSPVKLAVSVALLIMFNVLLVMYIQEERFAEKGRYRFWGDVIFLVPGLVWWLLHQKHFF